VLHYLPTVFKLKNKQIIDNFIVDFIINKNQPMWGQKQKSITEDPIILEEKMF